MTLFMNFCSDKDFGMSVVNLIDAHGANTMFNKKSVRFWLLVILFFSAIWISKAHAVTLSEHPKLQAIADQLIAEKHYTQSELNAVFAKATVQQSVLNAMKNPAEYKFTWGKYRKIFIQDDRIQRGVQFWQEYESELQRAEQTYGVPASIIVAIIGVESKFGQYKGKHKVLDSLVSLVIDFPRRSAFFAKELKEFLILTKENDLDSSEILGSYAGAVGFPQFISSSYRHYAVDFSGDGKTDLIDQPVDAIGSVANYFVKNGWLKGEPVSSNPHQSVSDAVASLANRKRKIQFTAQSLREKGAQLDSRIQGAEKLNVLMLDANEVVNEPRSSNVYVVRAGDTVCQIAERFKTPCKSLFTLNRLNDKGTIFRGQRLKLPPVKGKASISSKSQKIDAGKWKVSSASSAIEPIKSGVQERYFYTHENFYVITRYNHSVLYAMAVHDLSLAIGAAKRQTSDRM